MASPRGSLVLHRLMKIKKKKRKETSLKPEVQAFDIWYVAM